VTGTPVNFSGMTGRALARFLKIVRSQKKLYLNESAPPGGKIGAVGSFGRYALSRWECSGR
jgi:hypothetical protein